MIELTLTLKETTAQIVQTSVTVNNSSIQDYVHADDHAQPTYEVSSKINGKHHLYRFCYSYHHHQCDCHKINYVNFCHHHHHHFYHGFYYDHLSLTSITVDHNRNHHHNSSFSSLSSTPIFIIGFVIIVITIIITFTSVA